MTFRSPISRGLSIFVLHAVGEIGVFFFVAQIFEGNTAIDLSILRAEDAVAKGKNLRPPKQRPPVAISMIKLRRRWAPGADIVVVARILVA